jgi:hypothetical protein
MMLALDDAVLRRRCGGHFYAVMMMGKFHDDERRDADGSRLK